MLGHSPPGASLVWLVWDPQAVTRRATLSEGYAP